MRLPVLCLLATLALPAAVRAQVGHPPDRSPYRDVRFGTSLTFLAGDVAGDGGKLGVGPHGGSSIGLRYDLRVSGPIQFGFSLSRANLVRGLADPDAPVATRFRGPVDQRLTLAGIDLQFNLTGGKTWHRLAPYVSGGFGLAFAQSTPQDTTQYKFGTKLFVAPTAGLRLFLTDHLHLRLEAKSTFWKLKYPASFRREPSQDPGTIDKPNALLPTGKLDEWTSNRTLLVGLGYSFSF